MISSDAQASSSTMVEPLQIFYIHTPTASFAIPHSLIQDSITDLFDKLSRKVNSGANGERVGPGWLKYEWNDTIWNLDDDSDYTIFTWRQKGSDAIPTLHLHNPTTPLPEPPAYVNTSYYLYRRPTSRNDTASPHPHRGHSVRSLRSRRSTPDPAEDDKIPKFKKEFMKFHNENGVRTVLGSVGPVRNVRMLLKNGYRHVYISRSFATKHGFIPSDASPGYYGYGGLVNIGKWPVVIGKTKTTHTVYLSEEKHFDCILGRSFMEARGVKTDPTDPTNVVCMDTGEKLDVEVVIIRDGNGEIVTIT